MPNSNKQPDRWYVPFLWAVFGLTVAILLLVFFTQPTFFGLEIPDSTHTAVEIFLGIGVAITLALLFAKKILAPAYKPIPWQEEIIKITKMNAKHNTPCDFDIIGDALYGSADVQVMAAGSQTLIRSQDSGVYNGRLKDIIWDGRFNAERQRTTNAFEGIGNGKTQKRVADLEMVFSGKQPEVSAKPTIIEKQTTGAEPKVGMAGEGEVEKANQEAEG